MPETIEQEFERLLKPVRPRALRYAHRKMNNLDDAQDIVATAVAKAWSAHSRYNKSYRFEGWFIQIVKNLCIDMARYRELHRCMHYDQPVIGVGYTEDLLQLIDVESEADHMMMRTTLDECLEHALANINPEFKVCMWLNVVDEFSYDDVARITGKSLGAVKSSIHRAKMGMREYIGLDYSGRHRSPNGSVAA